METPPPQNEILFAARAKPKYHPLGKNSFRGERREGEKGGRRKLRVTLEVSSGKDGGVSGRPIPSLSGEEDAVNRRVSSGSLVPPSCPRGPEDPAKSLQGSPDRAESPRGGGSDPRQTPGRGGAARRGGTSSAARPVL